MELAPVDSTITISKTKLTDISTVDFFSELLTMTLSAHNDKIIIEPQNILYNQGSGIKITGPLKAEINYKDIIESEEKIELTLSGTIENDRQQHETFTLYLFVWLDKTASMPVKNGGRTNLGSHSLSIQCEQTVEQLPDSVVDLNLYTRNITGHQHVLGQGRGYLVFGRRG